MALSEARQIELLCTLAFMEATDPGALEEGVPLVMEQLSVTKKNVYHGIEQLRAMAGQMGAVQMALDERLRDYRFERLGTVEQAILKVCGALLSLEPTRSEEVVLQGVRLAHRYASPAASALVHALLTSLLDAGVAAHEDEVEAKVRQLEEDREHARNLHASAHPAEHSPESL